MRKFKKHKNNQFCMEKKYKNIFNGLYFLGYRDNTEYEKAKIVILPVAYQGTCTWLKGTKNGPKAILNASYATEPFDEEAIFSLDKLGIHTLKIQTFSDKEKAKKVVDITKSITKQILNDNKFPVIIGGEHSISIGSIQAVAEKFNDISVLQFDAHTDIDGARKNFIHHHSTMARVILETTKITITQVGIRSCIEKDLEYAKRKDISIFFAHDIVNKKHKIKDILSTLKKNIYITIDVDAFDPSIFPNTGTPEPNGLKWQYVINLIKEVAKTRNIIGLDIVEHASKNPNKPHYSDYNATKLLHKVLCIIFKNKIK